MTNIDMPTRQDADPKAGQAPTALVVDLDDTLIHGDSLWESLAALARANVFTALLTCLTLLRGRAAFKAAVAKRTSIALSDVKLNEPLLAFLKTEARERPVILATAANERIAHSIAGELGLFSDVIASDGADNMKGAQKLAAIKARLAAKGLERFDYVGDSRADRAIWRDADHVYVVAPDAKAAASVAGDNRVDRHFEAPKGRPRDLLRAMRPHQWTKNALILLPLFLSHQFLDPGKVVPALIAFAAFSLCASATYFWNDILDIRADRAHPRKQKRPFAAGLVSIPHGVAFSIILLAVSFGLAAATLPLIVPALLAGYIVITLTYSLFLKEKLLVDAMTLGLLYSYRIVIGGAATGIVLSDWLIAFSTFFFFGLALVKRYTEIASKGPKAGAEKIAGRGYYASDREVIGILGVASSFISILIMALYIRAPEIVELYARPQLLWVVCVMLMYWLSRIWVLTHRGHMPDDPIVFAIRDKNSILAGLICGGAVLLAM